MENKLAYTVFCVPRENKAQRDSSSSTMRSHTLSKQAGRSGREEVTGDSYIHASYGADQIHRQPPYLTLTTPPQARLESAPPGRPPQSAPRGTRRPLAPTGLQSRSEADPVLMEKRSTQQLRRSARRLRPKTRPQEIEDSIAAAEDSASVTVENDGVIAEVCPPSRGGRTAVSASGSPSPS